MTFPHCDPCVLHAPGKCDYCDDQKDLQELRVLWKINFTEEYDASKMMCPAEWRRSPGVINAWHGNRAQRKPE